MKSVYVSRKEVVRPQSECQCVLKNFMPINSYFNGVLEDTQYQCNQCGKIISEREYEDRVREGLEIIL